MRNNEIDSNDKVCKLCKVAQERSFSNGMRICDKCMEDSVEKWQTITNGIDAKKHCGIFGPKLLRNGKTSCESFGCDCCHGRIQ